MRARFYCYFTKALTERQGSQKLSKSAASSERRWIAYAYGGIPFPEATGHRGLLSLLLAELGEKQKHKTCASNNQEIMRDDPSAFLPHSSYTFLLSAFTGLPGIQACSWEINQDYICIYIYILPAPSVQVIHIMGLSCRISFFHLLSIRWGHCFIYSGDMGDHGILSQGRGEPFGIWSTLTFPKPAF